MSFDEALASGTEQLDEIAGRFDVPIDGRSREQRAVLALVLHARHIYHAILRDCMAGDIATALLSLRALSEAGVLIHWIELSPTDHVEMWEAEANRHRLAAAKAFDAMDRKRGWDRFRAPILPTLPAEMEPRVRQVREAALLRGEHLPRAACLPTVALMAGTTVEAMRQIYEIVYRITSPWAHASEQVLAAYGPEARSDGTHIVPSWAWTARDVMGLTVPLFAILLGSASRMCGLGLEGECRAIQDSVADYPPEALGAVPTAMRSQEADPGSAT
jgi:hypothetical protein